MSKARVILVSVVALGIAGGLLQRVLHPHEQDQEMMARMKRLSHAVAGFSPAEFEPRGSYLNGLYRADPDQASGISPEAYLAATKLIQSFGYDCPKAELMNWLAFSKGYDVWCRGGKYEFRIGNRGGGWTVKLGG